MKNILSGLGVVLILMFSACTAESQPEQTEAEGSFAKNITVAEVTLNPEWQILDVRTPGEVADGIIEGATLINYQEIDFENKVVEQLSKDKVVLIYCAAGGRSSRAMAKLKAAGFQQLYNLEGGMGAWQSAGKPVVTP